MTPNCRTSQRRMALLDETRLIAGLEQITARQRRERERRAILEKGRSNVAARRAVQLSMFPFKVDRMKILASCSCETPPAALPELPGGWFSSFARTTATESARGNVVPSYEVKYESTFRQNQHIFASISIFIQFYAYPMCVCLLAPLPVPHPWDHLISIRS